MTQQLHPPRGINVFNAIAKPLLAAGVPMAFNGLLTVPGRKTGKPRTTALAIIDDGHRRWVWSPWGEVHWVRNLRAAGRATTTFRRREEQVIAVELNPEQRVAFFRDTLTPIAKRIRGGMALVRYLDGVDLSDPVAAAKDRPVFELLPVRMARQT
jgi:deazaflavin-dependent oxidoreductase (nitroreductase family)